MIIKKKELTETEKIQKKNLVLSSFELIE